MKNLFAKDMIITEEELNNIVGGEVKYDDGRKKNKEDLVYRYPVGSVVEVYQSNLCWTTEKAVIVEWLPAGQEGWLTGKEWYVPVYKVKIIEGMDAGRTFERHQSWIECHEL